MPDQRPGPSKRVFVAESSNTASACSATRIVSSVSTSGSVYRRRNACSTRLKSTRRRSPVAVASSTASPQYRRGAGRVTGKPERPPQLGQKLQPARRIDLEQGRRPAQQAGSRGHIAAGERASPGYREQIGRVRSRLERIRVGGPELGHLPIALLEVIADELLSLD